MKPNLAACLIHAQASGSTSAALTSTAAQATDPFGIRIAFRPGHPLSLLTWGQYLATVSRMSRTVEQQLQHHDWTALAAFNSERRQLVRRICVFCGVCVAAPHWPQQCQQGAQHGTL
jgi:hypothetical protein